MTPERYAAPLSVVKTQSDDQRKCPYCRWGSPSLYRLDSWPDDHAGCAHCVLGLLDDDYLIYHTPGPADAPTGAHTCHPARVAPPDSPAPTEPASASATNSDHRAEG